MICWLWLSLLLGGCVALPVQVERARSESIPADASTPLGRAARDAGGAPGLTGFKPLPDGASAWDARVALARQAKVSIDAQYFLLRNDETGRQFLRLLRDAAARGVRVRLLLDDLYTAGLDELLDGLAAHPNAEVRLFNPFPAGRDGFYSRFIASLSEFDRLQRRMHNKLYIADGALAVIGGRNIANEYFDFDASANFVDLDALVAGDAVQQAAATFDTYWNSDVVFPLHAIVPAMGGPGQRRERFEALTRDMAGGPRPDRAPPGNPGDRPPSVELAQGRLALVWAPATIHADSPAKVLGPRAAEAQGRPAETRNLRYDITQTMRAADREVLIVSPYLVPGRSGMAMFRAGLERQVRFRVLTNSLAATDEPLVHIGYKRYRTDMLRLGVELYELSPAGAHKSRRLQMFNSRGRLHSKTAVIDRRIVFMGSMNFDPRSDLHNTEMYIEIDSRYIASQVSDIIEAQMARSSYRVRLAPDDSGLQWVDPDAGASVSEEPETSFWDRFVLDMLAPFAAEDLL
ncbi:phospholipase D family protein [Ramlibacter sp. 2FC]|uniref:phospholipase D family protein n=1 Tax=Ramlibacter sp. 2FC TaxID=2502188 RepID=UPI00201D969A|nr:phospholipase D family protein [Ramlibacter sp. 2FC]